MQGPENESPVRPHDDRARAQVSKQLNWQVYGEELEDVYEQL